MKPAHILIVEDEAIVAMDIQARLEALGYTIAGIAASGERAMVLAAEARPDLVMMDIRLQGPMDGIAAAEQIRKRARIPIVFLTAHAEETTLQRAKLVEPFGYLLKPFQERELRTTVEMALYKHDAEERILHLNRLYAVLSQINQMIVRAADVSSVLTDSCALTAKHGEFPLVWIGQYAGDSDRTLHAVAGANSASSEQLWSVGATALAAGIPPVGGWDHQRAVQLGAKELQSYPAPWPELVKRFDLRALAVVPIRRATAVWGVIGIAAREGDFFGSQELNLLQEIALDVGYAVENLERECERRRIQEVLERREATLRSITENMRDMICLADHEGRFLYLTPSYQRALGYHTSSLVGRSIFDHVHPDDQVRVEAAFRAAFEQPEPRSVEYRYRHADGHYCWIESVGTRVAPDGPEAASLVISSRDVTERRQAQETIRQSEERYRNLVETAYDWVWEVDAEARYIYASPKVTELLGYAPVEVIGRTPFDFMSPEEARRVAAVFSEIATQRKSFASLENTNAHRSGRLVVLETSGVPVFGPTGEFRGYRGIDRDVTERKRLEVQLQQAQKMEAVGQLAGGVAHDFNNILAAMMLQLGLVQGNSSLDAETRAALQDLETQAVRAANLTRQLLLFSRRSVMEIRPLNLNEVITHLVKLLQRLLGEHIEIRFQGQESLPLIEGDSGMMEQVLMNLAVNARDAMPKGGRLLIQTARVETVTDLVTPEGNRPPGCYIRLSVTDTGSGMDDSTLKHIFEPFFTTKATGKGTGLGLATVYGIVKQHRGWIEVETEVGKGSTFRVWLPARNSPVSPETKPTGLEPIADGTETILLVEDEASVRRTVGQCLRRFGYQVLEAGDPTEAIQLWRSRSSEIDLLFTDMVMPGGTTGLELAERLRTEKPDLKVIICSGYSAEMVDHDHERLPGVVLLPKPFVTPVLAAVVRACLDGRSATTPDTPAS
jgi:PAS domain S-box-containing protein